jgi:signal peptidase II
MADNVRLEKGLKIVRERMLGIAFLLLGIDQITKYYAVQELAKGNITIFPGFDLTLRYNTGAAFNFLADAAGWQRFFFIGLAIIISVGIYIWMGRLSYREKLEGLGLSFILSGALGNALDRIIYGRVTDFILLYYKEWEWPAFNIADSAIFVGVCLLILNLFKKSPEKG